MFIPILMFILGLILLVKGGDWFVDGATGISRKFHVSEILIGATVVSIGTTLPEVMVSATDALHGSGQIAYGNAIGSIICNTALVAATNIAIAPSICNKRDLFVPISFFFGSAFLYTFVAIYFQSFSRLFGILLLGIFLAYMVITSIQSIKDAEDLSDEVPQKLTKQNPLWKDLLFLVLGAILIAVGANWLVHYGTALAKAFGVPETVIALTFVALGTSLPELVTAISALIKKHSDLSLGNIIGANLFNLVLVSGLSVTICPFDLPSAKTIGGMNASLVIDIPLMLLVMMILSLPALIHGKLRRWQGISLLTLYTAFCLFQIFL